MKTSLKIIGIGILLGVFLYGLDVIFRISAGTAITMDSKEFLNPVFYIFYTLPLTLINFFFFDYLNHKVNWEKYGQKYRISLGFVGSVVITLVVLFLLRVVQKVWFEGVTYADFIAHENLEFYFTSLIVSLIISLAFHAFYFYKMVQEKKVKEQKIIAGTASAKFESLKNQIDPHFLFNSLNVLTSLIEESPENAQKFTTSLSKIYRYVLEQKDKELVSVQEELRFADTYMKLLKMRFENSIFYELPTMLSNPEAKVVPLSLQLLLENTVKHNIVSESKPLHIRIFEDDGYLVVENDYQKKEVLGNRKGVGLQNIVDRYSLVTQRPVYIENTEEIFRIKLPILTQRISIMETATNDPDDIYFKARKRVKEIKDFYGSVISFCVIIPFLIFINYMTFWGFQWFWFPLFGWGIGIVIKGFNVFGYGADWEERKIRELMDKEVEHKNTWK